MMMMMMSDELMVCRPSAAVGENTSDRSCVKLVKWCIVSYVRERIHSKGCILTANIVELYYVQIYLDK